MAINDITNTPYFKSVVQNNTKETTGQRATDRAENTANKARAGRTEADTVQLSSDKVTMSSASALVQVGVDVATNTDDVRQSKVDRLKSLVQSGEYEMDSKTIAEKMLGSEIELSRYV